MADDLVSIGTKARQRRREQGLTQIQAAAKALAHRNDISEIENGRFTGSVSTLARYLHTLGLELSCVVAQRPSLEDLDALFPDEDEP